MSKQAEIERLLGLLESLTVGEIHQLREQIVKRVRRVDIPRAEFERLVKQNKSRLKQYEAYFNRKGVEIAQALARTRTESEISMMEKYDLDASKLEEWLPQISFEGNRVDEVRVHIQALEGKCTQEFFKQYFKQFPEFLSTSNRYRRGAKDPLNNLLNLGYEVLRRRVHLAVISSHLDPYLGYLHSTRMYHPALVYDMLEPWRTIAEEFILNYNENLSPESFIKHGDRSFLKRDEQIRFTNALDHIIDNKRIPYNRRGNSKTTRIRTAIKEEPKKLAQYIRGNSPMFSFLID